MAGEVGGAFAAAVERVEGDAKAGLGGDLLKLKMRDSRNRRLTALSIALNN